MKPTDKQLNFIKEICAVLEIKNPNCKTKQEASTWISNHIDSYNLELRSSWTKWWEAEDYEFAGMQVYDEYEG